MIFSARGSKPKWISFGMAMLFFGSLTTSLPHFLRGSNPLIETFSNESTIELCNSTQPQSNDSNPSSQRPEKKLIWNFLQLKHILYIGNLINGLSSASMTSLTFSYIEDIAPPNLASIYESIYFSVGAIGMGVGKL